MPFSTRVYVFMKATVASKLLCAFLSAHVNQHLHLLGVSFISHCLTVIHTCKYIGCPYTISDNLLDIIAAKLLTVRPLVSVILDIIAKLLTDTW